MKNQRPRKFNYNDDIDKHSYYTVQKILDMKEQNGKKYYLVKWLNWDVKTCTWQEESSVAHLKTLIKDYQQSRKYDQQNNIGLKKFDKVLPGMSPYEATHFYGHVLYGDQPKQIVSLQIIQKNNKKEVHFEVQWQPREDGFKPTNSLIESKILLEHVPHFVINFYQSKVRLLPQQNEIEK